MHQDKLHRHLQSDHNVIILDSNDLCFSNMKECDLVILFISGNEDLRMDELDAMNSYLKQGKSIALFVSSTSSSTCTSVTGQSVLNEFLSGFGIRIEKDGVVRMYTASICIPNLH